MSGGLFLGSLNAPNDHPLLRAHGIIHLVQAPWAPPARKEDGFVAYSIDIRDKESQVRADSYAYSLPLSLLPLLSLRCADGVSRSPSIVLAYLIRNHAMSSDAALAFVKRKRACAKPNPGFARTLIEWEHSWRRRAVQRRFTS
ncbi:protein-tyrosine phosphatase-like protein [Mycena latifolia]|nr:protein-tyrosine phosphatase-like protein [Mycena latifolia]